MHELVIYGIWYGMFVALLASAFHVMYRGCGFFVFTFGIAYLYAPYGMLACSHVLPLPLAAIAGIALSVVLGILLEIAVYRKLRIGGADSFILLLASIGAYVVLQNIISMTFGDGTRSVRTWDVMEGVKVLGVRLTEMQLVTVGVSTLVVIGVGSVLYYSKWGKILRAMANDAWLATAIGVHVSRVRVFAAGLGSAMAGIGGVLMSLDSDMTPTMGFHAMLLAIVACIIGGVRQFHGAVLGGLLVGVILHVVTWPLPTAWQEAIVFLILLFFLLFRPQGITGRQQKNAVGV